MVYDERIVGRYVELQSATEMDAEFTLAIRQDPEINKYLPKLDITLQQQKEWIRGQRNKEDDYFFVVWNKNGERIGTISIYNISGDKAEAGRLAMRGNAFQSIEAQLLSFRFGFNKLQLKEIVSFIYADNIHALRFTQPFRGVLHTPQQDDKGHMVHRVTNSKENFEICEQKLSALLYR